MIRATILMLLITIVGCAQKAEDTIRLIPEGYEGSVMIIYNQKDGVPKEYQVPYSFFMKAFKCLAVLRCL